MGLMNFFNRFSNAKKDKEYKELVEKLKLDHEQKILANKSYIKLLEEKIQRIQNEKSKLTKKKALKLSDAIIEVLEDSKDDHILELRELNVAQIIEEILNKKLKTKKKVKISSVRATLYYLIKQKKIRYGSERGTFATCIDLEAGNSPWDPR